MQLHVGNSFIDVSFDGKKVKGTWDNEEEDIYIEFSPDTIDSSITQYSILTTEVNATPGDIVASLEYISETGLVISIGGIVSTTLIDGDTSPLYVYAFT